MLSDNADLLVRLAQAVQYGVLAATAVGLVWCVWWGAQSEPAFLRGETDYPNVESAIVIGLGLIWQAFVLFTLFQFMIVVGRYCNLRAHQDG